MSKLKHNVTQHREARGLCKSQLAFYVGVNRSYVTKLEQGILEPSGEMMLRFARVLKQPVENIFQLADDEQNKKNISRPVSAASGNNQPRREQPKE